MCAHQRPRLPPNCWPRTVPICNAAWITCGAVCSCACRACWLSNACASTGWAAACAGNGVLNQSLKQIFERVRPVHEHGFAVADGGSWRLLPAVFRYLDRFEELAHRSEDSAASQETPDELDDEGTFGEDEA